MKIMSEIIREKIADGVYFNFIPDNRFKTIRITASLFLPITKETASANALAASLITRSCKAYPDFTSLAKKLDELYGAALYSTVRKLGEIQELRFTVSGIDDKYALDSVKISKELTELLCSALFEPNIQENAFLGSEFAGERRQLIEELDSEFNEKRLYAVKRCTEIMCENEPFSVNRTGTKESLMDTTSEQAYKAWTNAIESAKIELYMLGNTEPQNALNAFKQVFDGKNRSIGLSTTLVTKADEVKRVTERQEVTQSKLVMGFRTPYAEPYTDVAVVKLMCAVLGGTPSSKLFMNVREKMSLCYYCAARYNPNKGIIIIDSGVENANIEKTETAILDQLKSMQAGDITDEEIDAAKLALKNAYITSLDSLASIENFYLSQTFNRETLTPEESAEKIMAVTKEQIIEAAKAVSLDTIYVLTCNEQ